MSDTDTNSTSDQWSWKTGSNTPKWGYGAVCIAALLAIFSVALFKICRRLYWENAELSFQQRHLEKILDDAAQMDVASPTSPTDLGYPHRSVEMQPRPSETPLSSRMRLFCSGGGQARTPSPPLPSPSASGHPSASGAYRHQSQRSNNASTPPVESPATITLTSDAIRAHERQIAQASGLRPPSPTPHDEDAGSTSYASSLEVDPDTQQPLQPQQPTLPPAPAP